MNQSQMNQLYVNRRLAQGYPNLDKLALEKFTAIIESKPDATLRKENLLKYLDRLINMSQVDNILVLGCGPKPQFIKILMQNKYNVVGVEPVPSFVHSAREYLGASPDRVLEGAAERIPLDDASQQLVFFESVLEHVDSPTQSLSEISRVLAPGGVLVLNTTNRYKFSLLGFTGEYNVRYFNWLPEIVKECFVFHHLHYDPSLANFTERPAVHWFTFTELCRLGRETGFAKFYSLLDLIDSNDAAVSTTSKLKAFLQKKLINKVKFNPWLRALILTQISAPIIMLKRPEAIL